GSMVGLRRLVPPYKTGRNRRAVGLSVSRDGQGRQIGTVAILATLATLTHDHSAGLRSAIAFARATSRRNSARWPPGSYPVARSPGRWRWRSWRSPCAASPAAPARTPPPPPRTGSLHSSARRPAESRPLTVRRPSEQWESSRSPPLPEAPMRRITGLVVLAAGLCL